MTRTSRFQFPFKRRLQLLVLVFFCAVVALIWNEWFRDVGQRQGRVVTAGFIITLFTAFAGVWTLVFSGFRWKFRLAILGVALALASAGALSFRLDVSGDLVPILEWRWSRPEEGLASPPASGKARGEAPFLAGLEDSPQFLGPGRRAEFMMPSLSRDWSATPPREVWRMRLGPGYSAIVVASGLAVTQEQRGANEAVSCYEAATGKLQWLHEDEARYESGIGGVGPRATPTIVNDRVVALGATGILNYLDLHSGKRIWQRNILDDAKATVLHWGMAGSPLVHGDHIIVNAGRSAGRSLIAYDRATGNILWTGGDATASYSSPMIAVFSGIPHIVILNHNSIDGHDFETGSALWSSPWPGDQQKVAQPMPLLADRLFASSGYGVGGASLKITAVDAAEGRTWEVKEEWRTRRMKAKFSNMVTRSGYIYGLDDGVLACIDAGTGERVWKRGRYGHGQLVLVGDLLLVSSEPGELVLVEAVPEEHRELARFPVFTDKTWNCPTLAGQYLFVRNHREAVCLQLPVRDAGGDARR